MESTELIVWTLCFIATIAILKNSLKIVRLIGLVFDTIISLLMDTIKDISGK